MKHILFRRTWALAMVMAWLLASHAMAGPTLSLRVTGGGGTVQVTVSMSGLRGQQAAGFQAFLHYDPSQLSFVNGSYTSIPFGLAVIAPIAGCEK